MKTIYLYLLGLAIALTSVISLSSCSDTVITDLFVNEISAKDRMDSAYAQARREYGSDVQLVMVYGKNVNAQGKTSVAALDILLNASLDSIGTWLYIFKSPSDTSFRVYAPDPTPGRRDCINLTRYFSPYTVLNLIPDTSAANIIRGALDLIVTTNNVRITTSPNVMIDSDASLTLANSQSQIIRFNSNFTPSISSLNGNAFFQSGTAFERNMFLLPAAGTLNLPAFIKELDIFPSDVWVVNYKKKNSNNVTENLILATVVEANQNMFLAGFGNYKVINISKFFN
jgi:hypothetical protein